MNLLISRLVHIVTYGSSYVYMNKKDIENSHLERKLSQDTFVGAVLGQTDTDYLVLLLDWKDKELRIAERIGTFIIPLHSTCSHQGKCRFWNSSPDIITLV